MLKIRKAMLLAAISFILPVLPAGAMTMPAIDVEKAPSALVIDVRGHGHWHHDGHWSHRRDHRFHGRDDYYDRDDQSGVLFKSLITGTLFK